MNNFKVYLEQLIVAVDIGDGTFCIEKVDLIDFLSFNRTRSETKNIIEKPSKYTGVLG